MPEYNAGDARLRIVPDASGFKKELETKLDALKVDFTVRVNVALAQASADMARFREQENNRVINQRVNPQFSRATAEMGAWRAEQRAIPVNIPVNIDRDGAAAAGARAGAAASSSFAKEFAKITSQVGQLFGSVIDISKVIGITGLVANIPAAVTAVASLGQALSQLSGAALVVPGAIATAGASFGTLAVGLSGISDAYAAVTAAADESSTGQIQRAQAATSATQSLRNAVVDEAQAQKDVATARKDALNQLQDLNLELRGGQISEAQAVNDLAKARRDLAKGGFKDALDQRDAELRVESAEQRRIETHNRLIDTADRKADADAKGVDNADSVVAANERVVRSNQAVAAATQALADATGTSSAVADKAADALAKLSPQAAEFVNTLVGLKPRWEDLKRTVSGNLFDGASLSFTQFVDNVLPGLKTGMGSIATAWNTNIKTLLSSLGSTNSKGLLDRILGNTAEAQTNFNAAIDPLVRGIGTLTAAGSDAIPRLATAIGDVAERFANFIETADKDGRLDRWIDAGLDGFTNLGNILLNIGKMFSSINGALGGAGLLENFRQVTEKAATFLGSFEGQSKLKQFFAEGREEMDKLKPIIGNLIDTLPAIWQGVKNAWDVVAPILTTFTDMLKAAPDLVTGVVTAFTAWSTISPIIKGVNTGLGLFQLLLGGGGAAGGAGGIGGLLARLGLGGAAAGAGAAGAGAAGAAGAGALAGPALLAVLASLGITFGSQYAVTQIAENWGDPIPSAAESARLQEEEARKMGEPPPSNPDLGSVLGGPPPPPPPGQNADLKSAIEQWETDNNVAHGAPLSPEQNASLQEYLRGKGLRGFESGGPTGSGGLALLHPNEFVLSDRAQRYPDSLKHALNEGKLPLNALQHFVTGGDVKQGPAPTDPIAPAPNTGGIPSIFDKVITGIQAPINNAIQVAQQAGAAPGGAGGGAPGAAGGATPWGGAPGSLFSGGPGTPAWAGAPAPAGPPVLGPPSPPLPGLPFAPGGFLGGQPGPMRPGLPPPPPDVSLSVPLVPTTPDPAPPALTPPAPSAPSSGGGAAPTDTSSPAYTPPSSATTPDPNVHTGGGALPGPPPSPDYTNPYLTDPAKAPEPDALHKWLFWLPQDGSAPDPNKIIAAMPDKIQPANIANQFGQILLGGVLGFFGLENSILSPSNELNQDAQQTFGFFNDKFGGSSGSGSGTDTDLPAGVKVDADGNPFPADYGSNTGNPSVANVSTFLKSMAGKPYISGGQSRGGTDCSGYVSMAVKSLLGQDPYSADRMTTRNAADWITGKGGRLGVGPPGTLRIGWYNHGPNAQDGHMAGTLPDGTNFESGGGGGGIRFGGGAAGADSAQFDMHAYFQVPGTFIPPVTVPDATGAPVATGVPPKSTAGTSSTPATGSKPTNTFKQWYGNGTTEPATDADAAPAATGSGYTPGDLEIAKGLIADTANLPGYKKIANGEAPGAMTPGVKAAFKSLGYEGGGQVAVSGQGSYGTPLSQMRIEDAQKVNLSLPAMGRLGALGKLNPFRNNVNTNSHYGAPFRTPEGKINMSKDPGDSGIGTRLNSSLMKRGRLPGIGDQTSQGTFDGLLDALGIPHLITGGGIPGAGSGDTVPAMLTPGEHVLTTGDVKAMGGQGGVYAFRQRLHMAVGGAAVAPMAVPVVPPPVPTPIVRPPDANVKIAPSVPRPAPPRPVPAAPAAPRTPTGPAPGGPAAGPSHDAPPPATTGPAQGPPGMPAPEQPAPAISGEPIPASGPDPTAPAPESYDHNLPAIDTGIDSAATAIGQAASTAIGALAGAAAGAAGIPGIGAAGAIGPYVAGLVQQGGKIAKNVVNIGSSFLVGNVTPGTQDNAYGERLAPEQKTPQAAELDGGRQYIFNGIDSRNVVDEIRIKDRQDQQAVLARW